jgi:DNA-binding response OmpR family regulator
MNFQVVPLSELSSKGIIPLSDPPKPIVLVVDDEVIIADTLTAILARNGMAVLTAYDGRTALDIAQTIPPDLLLTDVVMPDMSGIDLAIAIQQTIPDCKILLFSGQAATADLLATASDAGHDFTIIAKPVHPTDLLVRVSESLKSQTTNIRSAVMVDSSKRAHATLLTQAEEVIVLSVPYER